MRLIQVLYSFEMIYPSNYKSAHVCRRHDLIRYKNIENRQRYQRHSKRPQRPILLALSRELGNLAQRRWGIRSPVLSCMPSPSQRLACADVAGSLWGDHTPTVSDGRLGPPPSEEVSSDPDGQVAGYAGPNIGRGVVLCCS